VGGGRGAACPHVGPPLLVLGREAFLHRTAGAPETRLNGFFSSAGVWDNALGLEEAIISIIIAWWRPRMLLRDEGRPVHAFIKKDDLPTAWKSKEDRKKGSAHHEKQQKQQPIPKSSCSRQSPGSHRHHRWFSGFPRFFICRGKYYRGRGAYGIAESRYIWCV